MINIEHKITGRCQTCGEKVTIERPGLRFSGWSSETHHLDCVMEDVMTGISNHVENARDKAKEWSKKIEPKRKKLRKGTGKNVKYYTWLTKQLTKAYDGGGIWETLFSNGIISNKTLIEPEIDLLNRLDLDQSPYVDGRQLQISPRGIGHQKHSGYNSATANYESGPMLLMLVTAYKDEIAQEVSKRKNRREKFERFAKAVEETLDPNILANLWDGAGKFYEVIARINFAEHDHIPDKIEMKGEDCHALRIERSHRGKIKFKGVYKDYSQSDTATRNISWQLDFQEFDMYKRVIPIAINLLEEAEEWKQEVEEEMREKLDKIESKVDKYLTIYSI